MGVKVIDKTRQFKAKNILALDRSLSHMGLDIERSSKMQVPHDKGTLQSTVRYKRKGLLKHQIRAGEAPPASAPYARRWEFETPRHGFKKGRKSRYLRDPARTITRKHVDYFKKQFATIRI